MQLIRQLPNVNFTAKQKEVLLSHIIENVGIFGKHLTIAENLSYLINGIQIIPEYETDWKTQNQLMLTFQYLNLGQSLVINLEKLANMKSYEEKHSPSKKSIAVPLNLPTFGGAVEFDQDLPEPKLDKGFTIKWTEHASASVRSFKDIPLDFISSRVQKADTLISRRNIIHTAREETMVKKDIAKDIYQKIDNVHKEPIDKDKRVYKRIMFSDSEHKNSELDN